MRFNDYGSKNPSWTSSENQYKDEVSRTGLCIVEVSLEKKTLDMIPLNT